MKYYQITVVKNGQLIEYPYLTKKQKNVWLYNYIVIKDYSLWAREQWNKTNYKTINKWYKAYVERSKKDGSYQFISLNSKTGIIIKEIKKNKKDGKNNMTQKSMDASRKH